MKTTPNLKLKKIQLTDSPPDITVLNTNWDKLDTEVQAAKATAESASVMTDTTTGSKYKWGIDNKIAYIEEVG